MTSTRLIGVWLPAAALVALATALLGCGGGGHASTGPPPQVTVGAATTEKAAQRETDPTAVNDEPVPYQASDKDKDNDLGAVTDETANGPAYAEFGPIADPATTSTVTSLVRRYYAAAVGLRAGQACSMILPSIARSAGEDYSYGYLEGAQSCTEVMKRMFVHLHRRLAVAVPRLEVRQVRARTHRAAAVLGFGGVERQIQLTFDKGRWRIGQLLDGPAP